MSPPAICCGTPHWRQDLIRLPSGIYDVPCASPLLLSIPRRGITILLSLWSSSLADVPWRPKLVFPDRIQDGERPSPNQGRCRCAVCAAVLMLRCERSFHGLAGLHRLVARVEFDIAPAHHHAVRDVMS